MSPLSLWCLIAVFTLYFCGLYLHIYPRISSVFLPNKMKNKWWVHLNNQSLLDCICIVCMFVFLLSTICLHLCVNYFSMCLLKVFLNEKWIIVFLNFFIHHHRWWSLVHWGPLSICWVSFLVCTTKYIELAPLSLTRALFVHFFMAGIIALHLTTAIKSSFFRTVFEMCFTFFSE